MKHALPAWQSNKGVVDVAILGAGPAGATTALSLKRTNPDLSVVLLEATPSSATSRVGETLSPLAWPFLCQLGLDQAMRKSNHIPVFSTLSAWGSAEPIANEYFSQTHAKGWHLDRHCFDQMLLDAARAAGVECIHRKVRSVLASPASDGAANHVAPCTWSVHLAASETTVASQLQARFVVDASGRRAMMAKQQGQKVQVHDQLLGAMFFFNRAAGRDSKTPGDAISTRFQTLSQTLSQAPSFVMAEHQGAPLNHDTGTTLVEAGEHGWWYSAYLPDQRIVVAAMTDVDLARQLQLHSASGWQQHLARSHHTLQRVLNAACKLEGSNPIVRAAYSQVLPQCTGHAWLAVGDAASSVDPLSAQGIVRSLRFGTYASYAICDWFAGKKPGLVQYEALVQAEFLDFLKVRRDVYRHETRWLNAPFWKRRHI